MAKKKFTIGIDLGGTKVLVLLLDHRFKPVDDLKIRFDAGKGSKHFLQELDKAVKELLDKRRVRSSRVAAVGIGAAGMIDFAKGIVRLSPNIAFLKDFPMRKKLESLWKIPVFVENDVNAGLYGEWKLGAAKGYEHVVGVFPGTGIGGALILDGKLYRGFRGMAGEVGHMFLTLDGLLRQSPRFGTLEALTSRLTIASEASRLALMQKTPALYELAGTDPRKMKSGTLKRALDDGDRELKELIEFKSKLLGVGLANLVNIINPELVVLGGGLIEALGTRMIPAAESVMRKLAMPPNVEGVKLKVSKLGDYAVAMGAAVLASEVLSGQKKDG